MDERGFVSEIFPTVQGEGPCLGYLQIMVRLAGCTLGCSYCDTLYSQERTGKGVLSGAGMEEHWENPVGEDELYNLIAALAGRTGRLHSVSITGGEPLEQPVFLHRVLTRLKKEGFRTYLDTNGLNLEDSRRIAPLADIVSLDIKLPSLCRGEFSLEEYRDVLPVFSQAEMFCKVVIPDGYDQDEFELALAVVAEFDNRLPLVIQPVTEVGMIKPPSGEQLLHCLFRAMNQLEDVRLIPQCHRLLDLP